MGMSASQVRLLTLQDRKSTIGLRLGSLATQKRSLNRQMTKLANEYNASFSSKKLQWYDTINNDYTDITYANLMTPSINNSYKPFVLTDRASGKVILDSVTQTTNNSMHNLTDTSMSKHMERLTGVTSNEYIPGSKTLTQDMEFYIIEDLIGVQNFNRYKMRYTPIENLEKSLPQVDHVSVLTLLDDFTASVGNTANDNTWGKMYLYGKGNAYNDFNDKTLWKAAYDSNAVVQLYDAANDDKARSKTSEIVESFVDSLLEYKPIANLKSLSEMDGDDLGDLKQTVTDSVMKVIFATVSGNDTVFNPDVSNVDTVLNYKVIENSEGKYHVAYYSNRVNDPIQNLPEDPLGMYDAAVPQANETVSLIKVSYPISTGNGQPINDPNALFTYFISVANMMDVAMYYLSINLEEAESHEDSVYQIANNGKISEDSFCPGAYSNETSMSIYEAGEISVPSMYSVYSNLGMINSKLENIMAHIDKFPEWTQNDSTDNTPKINKMKAYLKSIIDGNKSASESDLTGIANMNIWLAQAMTSDDPSEFRTLINKAYTMYTALNNYDLSDNADWATVHSNSALTGGFYYDADVDNYDKREFMFTQNSKAISASSAYDITSQLNADELNKFDFYKKLIKECLAKGWTSNDNVNDKSYLDAALTNGKWLIDDDIASNSRRVFEVTNDDVIDEAHSKYESLLTLITSKEEKIDREMSNLETQQNAINTELDSLKKIINDNIQTTFKIMG